MDEMWLGKVIVGLVGGLVDDDLVKRLSKIGEKVKAGVVT
jgi:hypothetical protein